MIDVNLPITKAYKAKLTGVKNTTDKLVPIFYNEAPEKLEDAEYVIVQSSGFTNVSTKTSHDLKGSIEINIHTQKAKFNNGVECDYIAGQILQAVYSKVYSKIFTNGTDTAGIQEVSMRLVRDTPGGFSFKGGFKIVSRKLVFEHVLFLTKQDLYFKINNIEFLLNSQPFLLNS